MDECVFFFFFFFFCVFNERGESDDEKFPTLPLTSLAIIVPSSPGCHDDWLALIRDPIIFGGDRDI